MIHFNETAQACFVDYVNDPEFLQNFIKLTNLAGSCQVSFSLNYQESSNQWFAGINSAAPSEVFVGKDTLLEFALKDAIEHLEKLLQPK